MNLNQTKESKCEQLWESPESKENIRPATCLPFHMLFQRRLASAQQRGITEKSVSSVLNNTLPWWRRRSLTLHKHIGWQAVEHDSGKRQTRAAKRQPQMDSQVFVPCDGDIGTIDRHAAHGFCAAAHDHENWTLKQRCCGIRETAHRLGRLSRECHPER